MTERMRVTEGLGSAMLSIWPGDVLCTCTVLHCMYSGITLHPYEVVLSLTVGANVTKITTDKHNVNNCTHSAVFNSCHEVGRCWGPGAEGCGVI